MIRTDGKPTICTPGKNVPLPKNRSILPDDLTDEGAEDFLDAILDGEEKK